MIGKFRVPAMLASVAALFGPMRIEWPSHSEPEPKSEVPATVADALGGACNCFGNIARFEFRPTEHGVIMLDPMGETPDDQYIGEFKNPLEALRFLGFTPQTLERTPLGQRSAT